VGQLDQFAKETFARETAAVTHGAVAWQHPPEIRMSEVRLDGLLRVLDPAPLAALAAPWCTIGEADELAIEIKMPGDHLDLLSLDRAARGLLRCARRKGGQGECSRVAYPPRLELYCEQRLARIKCRCGI
jgi:hypothetical protein